jgi:YVTN family beta-propeller protein
MKPRLLLMLALVMGAGLVAPDASAQPTVIASIPVGGGHASVAVNPATNRIYVTNPPSAVSVIDGATNLVAGTVAVGDYPVGVAVNPATNRIYVTNLNGRTVSVIDGASNAIAATIPVGAGPMGVAVNPGTDRIYVTHGLGVSVIDGGTNTVVATVPLGFSLGVAVNPATNLIYVASSELVSHMDGMPWSESIKRVSVIDGATNSVVATVPVDWSVGVAVNPATNLIYVANADGVSVIDGGTNRVVDTVLMGENTSPAVVAVNPLSNRMYVTVLSGVSVIDGATNSVVYTLELCAENTPGPRSVAVNPITSFIYATPCADGRLFVVIDDSPGAAPPPAASPTPVPAPTPTACPPAPAPPPADGTEWVALQCGTCNPNATTYPDNTPIATIAGAVTPPETVESLWGFEGDTWRGWSPRFPAISDLTQVDRLDVVFICVGGSATFTRPTI